MGKVEDLEKLQKLKNEGGLTEEEFNKEKTKILNNKTSKNKIIIIAVILVIVVIISLICFFMFNNTKKNDVSNDKEENDTNTEELVTTSGNIQANGTGSISFENINSDDENLTEIQRDIISYFDNDYFWFFSKYAQKYPQIFQNSKVKTSAAVVKVLKSTNDEFEVLAVDCGESAYNYYADYDIKDIPVEQLLVISGKQLNERLTTGDIFFLYGRYKDVENKEIDKKTYMVSKIEANNIVKFDEDNQYIPKYNYSTIKNVAEYIFGKDIKISEDNNNPDYYKVTLDNQSNANFKVFDMYKDYGAILYNKKANDLSNNITKKLFVSADFQHHIVSTYDENTKHVYIDYFDKDLKKVWGREFDYASTKAFSSPMDYSDTQMAVVVDNDLYLIDLATGENVIEPVMVGEKVRVVMMSDGIVLIGDNNKDAIMKVDYEGKTIFKTNAGTDSMKLIESAHVQIINNKLTIFLSGISKDAGMEKYLIVDNKGKIETSSEDMDTAG